jgi:hypothetical protein
MLGLFTPKIKQLGVDVAGQLKRLLRGVILREL